MAESIELTKTETAALTFITNQQAQLQQAAAQLQTQFAEIQNQLAEVTSEVFTRGGVDLATVANPVLSDDKKSIEFEIKEPEDKEDLVVANSKQTKDGPEGHEIVDLKKAAKLAGVDNKESK